MTLCLLNIFCLIDSFDLSQFVTKLIFGCQYSCHPPFFFFFFFNVHKYIIIIIWTGPIMPRILLLCKYFVLLENGRHTLFFSYLRLLLGKVLLCKRCQFFIYLSWLGGFRVFILFSIPLFIKKIMIFI